MTPSKVIQKKRDGGVHTDEEIAYLIRGFLAHEITNYHMSAWLMAVYINGMTPKEVLALTREIALHWAEWQEDGRVVKSLLFSGPVRCQDLELPPPPKGKIAACIPFPNRAEARFVPDPEIHCRE